MTVLWMLSLFVMGMIGGVCIGIMMVLKKYDALRSYVDYHTKEYSGVAGNGELYQAMKKIDRDE